MTPTPTTPQASRQPRRPATTLNGRCLCYDCVVRTLAAGIMPQKAPRPADQQTEANTPRPFDIIGPALVESDARLTSTASQLEAALREHAAAIKEARGLVREVQMACGQDTQIELPGHVLHVRADEITIVQRIRVAGAQSGPAAASAAAPSTVAHPRGETPGGYAHVPGAGTNAVHIGTDLTAPPASPASGNPSVGE